MLVSCKEKESKTDFTITGSTSGTVDTLDINYSDIKYAIGYLRKDSNNGKLSTKDWWSGPNKQPAGNYTSDSIIEIAGTGTVRLIERITASPGLTLNKIDSSEYYLNKCKKEMNIAEKLYKNAKRFPDFSDSSMYYLILWEKHLDRAVSFWNKYVKY